MLNLFNQIEIHTVENNSVSQKILNENRMNFSHDAQKVLDLLLEGKELTNFWLIQNHITNSPTRRFSDLKQNGIKIERVMKPVTWSDRKEMHYFLLPEEIERIKNLNKP